MRSCINRSPFLQCLVLAAVVCHWLCIPSTIAVQVVVYKRISELDANSKTASGDYKVYPKLSFARCSNICFANPTCCVFALDDRTGRCQVYSFITPTQTLTPAPSTLLTYAAVGKFYFINLALNNMNWNEGSDGCNATNGIIAVDHDLERMKFLLQWFEIPIAMVGVEYRSGVWLDYKGDPVPADLWADGEPWDPPYTKAYFRLFGQVGLYSMEPYHSATLPSLCLPAQ